MDNGRPLINLRLPNGMVYPWVIDEFPTVDRPVTHARAIYRRVESFVHWEPIGIPRVAHGSTANSRWDKR